MRYTEPAIRQFRATGAGVDSQPGVGSTFWLTARLGPGRSRTPAAALPPVHDAQAELLRRCRGARVLLVEDDAINREVALELLAAAGLSVSTAVDGREALQRLGDDRFDLVLMDLQMPGMDGYQATRLLRALPDAAQLPVVAMSANAFEEVRQACLAAGMNDFVPKPVEPGLLYTTLLRWLPQVADAAAPAAARPAAAAAALTPAPRLAALARALAAIDGLAIDACLSALHGDLTLYTALLQQLARSHGNDAGAIAGHLAAGRFDEAQQLAHRLKGAAGALGAKPLQEAAAALDASLRRHDPPAQQQPLCLALAEVGGRLFQAIARLPAETGGDAPPAPDAARTRALLLQLEPLLAADDTAAGELFDHHRELLRATLGAVAARLGWQMERYDYPAALQTVRQALAQTTAP